MLLFCEYLCYLTVVSDGFRDAGSRFPTV